MPSINIDNKEYDFDTLSPECKAQLLSIQFCDQELSRLDSQSAVLKTAKSAYLQALKKALPVIGVSDTLKFS
jgi:hypothetical protein